MMSNRQVCYSFVFFFCEWPRSLFRILKFLARTLAVLTFAHRFCRKFNCFFSCFPGRQSLIGNEQDRLVPFCPEDPSSVMHFFNTSESSGSIILPDGITDVIIDVGQHSSPIIPTSENTFVIGFEPIPHIHRKNVDSNRDLHSQNLLNIQMAAGECDRVHIFKELKDSQSSSLRDVVPEQGIHWLQKVGSITRPEKRFLFQVIYTYPVVVTKLHHVLIRLPYTISVSMLKIDAQGFDFDVLKGCGEAIRRVKEVVVEACVNQEQLYRGASTKAAIVQYMVQHGFSLTSVEPDSYGQEENLFFLNTN